MLFAFQTAGKLDILLVVIIELFVIKVSSVKYVEGLFSFNNQSVHLDTVCFPNYDHYHFIGQFVLIKQPNPDVQLNTVYGLTEISLAELTKTDLSW